MLLVTAFACSVGVFLLVDGQYRTSLSREMTAAGKENDTLRTTLAQELQISPTLDARAAAQALGDAVLMGNEPDWAYCLSSQKGTILVGHVRPFTDLRLLGALEENQQGFRLVRGTHSHYVHVVSTVSVNGETVYLENWRNVEPLLVERADQYRGALVWMGVMLLIVGLIALVVSAWIARPLMELSAASAVLAAGDLSKRVKITNRQDEVGKLSQDFNHMADQLEQQMEQLEQASKQQEAFLHSFAHETKTPLTSIIGYAELLLSHMDSPDIVREGAGYIFREGRRMERLSQKLMEWIVLEKSAFSMQEVEMGQYLAAIACTVEPAMKKKEITLLVEAEPSQIWLEPDLIETVCMNLLDNAAKSIEGKGKILLKGSILPEGYQIEVTDSGKGIPQEELGRITEAFYMVDKSRARAQGGAGLGLSICRKIIELHGGTLSFESEIGKGTSVYVVLKGGGPNA